MNASAVELVLTVEAEALSLRSRHGRLLRRWPFHSVLCWGFARDVFLWRAFAGADSDDERRDSEDHDAALDAALADDTVLGNDDELLAGARGAALAALAVRVAPPADGQRVERTVMAAVVRLMEHMSARGLRDDELAALLSTLHAVAAAARAADACTGRGAHAPDAVTGASGAGAGADAFGSDVGGGAALAAVRQVALTRRLDARQATAVLRAFDDISPFDKVRATRVQRCAAPPRRLARRRCAAVPRGRSDGTRISISAADATASCSPGAQVDAAVALHGSLLEGRASFPVVLEAAFPHAADRSNVAARLGGTLRRDGTIDAPVAALAGGA